MIGPAADSEATVIRVESGAVLVDSDRATTAARPARASPGTQWSVRTSVSSRDPLESLADTGQRYEMRAPLGEGGMGEVFSALDRRVGREVALKRMRRDKTGRMDLRERFVREARVQGQLEHPSVVPIYDLARDPDGTAYFTMKRIRGETLEEVLDLVRADRRGDGPARTYTRHKLLTAFASVCLAMHYAHTSGVVHRDLKPSNVMLGYFGEVYVLDWGVAKIASDAEPDVAKTGSPPMVSSDSGSDARTEEGAVLGTPGYMAPEQWLDGGEVDERADVYALGAILFEILTLDPLHGFGKSDELAKRTLRGSDARASVCAPERRISPELDAICVRATQVDRAARYATALELHEALEAVLSGDRDIARRRELAAGHARAASEAVTRAISAPADAVAGELSVAMREVSRAVALDPQNRDALRTLVRLFSETPGAQKAGAIPREARRELASAHLHSQRVGARTAAAAYASIALYSPFALWMGMRRPALAVVYLTVWIVCSVLSLYAGRARRPSKLANDVLILLSNIGVALGCTIFGPFMMIPAIAGVNTLSFVVSADRSRRYASIVCGCFAIFLPAALQQGGYLPPSLVFRDGTIVIVPNMLSLPETATLTFLLAATLGAIITGALAVARFRDTLVKTEQRLYFQTWLLRQFVPDDVYDEVAPGKLDSMASMPRARAGKPDHDAGG
jgi:serine/threonine-protein kinase